MSLKKFFATALLVVATSTVARAGDDTSVAYLVHGINGADIGAMEALPVDVEVNGECLVPGFTFGTVLGPLDLPAGEYDINISLANEKAPCSNDVVIPVAGLPIDGGTAYAIVAHLDADGAPTASRFEIEIERNGRTTPVNVGHAAAAGPVDLEVDTRRGRRSMTQTLEAVPNGVLATVPFRRGFSRITIFPAGEMDPVLGPAPLFVGGFADAYFVLAVGTAGTDTFGLIVEPIINRGDDDGDEDDDDEKGDD